MRVHAIRLPQADYVRDSTNNNDVTALSSGRDHQRRTELVRVQNASLSWNYSKPHSDPSLPTGAVEIVRTPTELQDKIAAVLDHATQLGGLLFVTLDGDRHLIVPAHHWPVFQVIRS